MDSQSPCSRMHSSSACTLTCSLEGMANINFENVSFSSDFTALALVMSDAIYKIYNRLNSLQ